MTRPIKIRGKTAEVCEECGMFYKDKKLAKKCEEWCRKHRSCNLEIIKNAIKIR